MKKTAKLLFEKQHNNNRNAKNQVPMSRHTYKEFYSDLREVALVNQTERGKPKV